jgi:hypothetical protein
MASGQGTGAREPALTGEWGRRAGGQVTGTRLRIHSANGENEEDNPKWVRLRKNPALDAIFHN